jgi:uncharacterized protein (TIGR03000 family)
MYSMVLLAALTTAVDMPDRGRRGGGCCGGCYGGMGWGGGCWGGCYGMGMGGWGGCYGMGMGGWGGCYGMGMGGWGGYVLNGSYPTIGGYAYSPMIGNYGTPLASANGAILSPGVTQSFYANPTNANQANEATIVVHLPEGATLTIDGQPTQSRSATRIFHSPPLERGKTFTYTLRADLNRNGHFVNDQKTIEVRAGERSEVTLNFDNANRTEERRAPLPEAAPGERSFPPPPPDR